MVQARSLHSRVRGPGGATPRGTAIELGVGALLLVAAAIGGLAFVHRPWPNRLDRWGYLLLPENLGSWWANELVKLGSMTVLVAGVAVILLIGVVRDWVRAVACAAAPVLAVLFVEGIAKPLVGRHNLLTGGLSYPSGTVAAVAALATAATMVMPPITRPVVAAFGATLTVCTCAAVIILRWHYATDALGGVAVGIGSVLVLDALLHAPWVVTQFLRPAGADERAEEQTKAAVPA